MKKYLVMTVLASGLLFAVNSLADDQLPANAVSASTVLENLQKAGFTGVRKVKFENDVYEAVAINHEGRPVKVAVNPTDGQVSKESKAMAAQLTILDAAKKVEKAGYTHISEIELEKNKFDVKALDKNGKKVDLEVDGQTGNIKED